MTHKSLIAAAAAAFLTMASAPLALAEMITVSDAYMRVTGAQATSAAAFMLIENHGAEDDRLINVASEAAAKVQLHTHLEDANGVMKMVHVEEGFAIPAGEGHVLARGGDHVMFLGLNAPLAQGEAVKLTLTFEKAGDIMVDLPVDNERKPMHGKMGHSKMNQGTVNN